jgi:hypothetical protein
VLLTSAATASTAACTFSDREVSEGVVALIGGPGVSPHARRIKAEGWPGIWPTRSAGHSKRVVAARHRRHTKGERTWAVMLIRARDTLALVLDADADAKWGVTWRYQANSSFISR